jgi:hypothetical protein
MVEPVRMGTSYSLNATMSHLLLDVVKRIRGINSEAD